MKDVQIVNYDNTRQVIPMEYSVSQEVSTCPLRACLHGRGRPQLGEVPACPYSVSHINLITFT